MYGFNDCVGERTMDADVGRQCLTINVKIPDGPVPKGGFPILIWIFGLVY